MNKKQILSVAASMVMLTACNEYDPGLIEGGAGDYTPAELQLMEKYTENFEARYGTIDENHTWGFGSAEVGAKTRAVNANANEWADPNYGGWIVPPPLTDAQIAVVKKYFQTHQSEPAYENPNWTNYFIQQVYKGGTNPMEGYSPERYWAANDETEILAGENMDHLVAIDGEFVDHNYNFNKGDCGINEKVLNNGYTVNNDNSADAYHSDKIVLMENSTTKSFGYANSVANVVLTDYTWLVDYKTIMAAMGSEADCLDDGWNRSFMGFDFANVIGEDIYVDKNWGTFHRKYNDDGTEVWSYHNEFAAGYDYPTFDFGGQSYRLLTNQKNRYAYDKNVKYGGKVNLDDYKDEDGNNGWKNKTLVAELLSLGYLPVADTKEFIKLGTGADGYYSDWIVTLTEAKKTPNTPDNPDTPSGETWYRIMCEDLGNTNDFDFNDLVFDVSFTKVSDGNYTAHVRVQAAGGTLPIYLHNNENKDFEAHHLLSGSDRLDPINVGTGNTAAPKDIYIYNLTSDNPNYINIYVEKTAADKTKESTLLPKSGTNRLLNKAPQKICIPISEVGNVRWMKEMQQIEWGYPHFEDWVQNESYGFKWTTTEVNTAPLY